MSKGQSEAEPVFGLQAAAALSDTPCCPPAPGFEGCLCAGLKAGRAEAG